MGLPETKPEFLAWLAASGVPGDNHDERVAWFLTNALAAKFMPPDLRQALTDSGPPLR